MRLEERRTLKVILGIGAIAALIPISFLTFLVFLGLTVAPAPVAERAAAPPFVKDALWARAGGGRATELRMVNPFGLAGLLLCSNLNGDGDDPQRLDAENLAECAKWLPALQGMEYLSNLHVREHGVERNSFRGGAGAMATMLRLSGSWTREDFLNTLAARADLGYGWHGVEAAAQGFFGRPATALTLAEAALLASRVGDTRTDPWCEPAAATRMRNRVLERMRTNGAIPEPDFQSASIAELGLGSPPEGRPACKE